MTKETFISLDFPHFHNLMILPGGKNIKTSAFILYIHCLCKKKKKIKNLFYHLEMSCIFLFYFPFSSIISYFISNIRSSIRDLFCMRLCLRHLYPMNTIHMNWQKKLTEDTRQYFHYLYMVTFSLLCTWHNIQKIIKGYTVKN